VARFAAFLFFELVIFVSLLMQYHARFVRRSSLTLAVDLSKRGHLHDGDGHSVQP
jgi:hypothetical protein